MKSYRVIILYTLVSIYISAAYGQEKSALKKQGAPTSHAAKKNDPAKIARVTKAYTTAIDEYIKAVYKKGVARPDTLFIGRNADMPDIVLPQTIGGLNVLLISGEEGKKKLKYHSTLTYLNVVGWVNGDQPEFIVVAFNNFSPQHTCSMHFKYNGDDMVLDKLFFQFPNNQDKGAAK